MAEYRDEYIADVTRYVHEVDRAAGSADEFGDKQAKAALQARKMALAADEAGDKAAAATRKAATAAKAYEQAAYDAANAADALGRGQVTAAQAAKANERAEKAEERAIQAATRAMRQKERADIAATAAAMAAAKAIDDEADQMRQLDRAGSGRGIGQSLLTAANGFRKFRSETMRSAAGLVNWRTGALLLANALVGPLAVGAAAAAAQMTAAGAAVGAFGLAVAPQLSAISNLKTAQDAYAKAVQKSGKDSTAAKNALHAYNAQLKELPPATRQTANAFLNLRTAFHRWSDSLASVTMPVFTRGLNLVRELLPKTTGLVKTAAGAFKDFLGSIEHGVKGGGFDRFMTMLNKTAADSLPHLLGALKNTAVGAGRLMMAFLPLTAGDFSRGLESLTKKFSDWAGSMRDNPAFTNFVQKMKDELPGILTLLGNLVKIVFNLAAAFAPLSGTTLKAVEKLSSVIASIPQDVLTTVAQEITAIVLATKAWAAAQAITNLVMEANPYVAAATALIVLGTAFTIAFKKSQTFRDIVVDVAVTTAQAFIRTGEVITNVLLSAFDGIVQGAAKAFGWIPGVGKRIQQSAKDIHEWKNSVVGSFDHASDSVEKWGDSVKNAPKVAKLKGDIKDLEAKIATSKAKLKSVNDSKTRAKIEADIARLQAKVAAAKRALASIRGRTVPIDAYVRVHQQRVSIPGGGSVLIPSGRYAEGGYVGFADGGIVDRLEQAVKTVRGFPTGGPVNGRGTGTSDSIDARLSNGEYVVRAARTRQFRPLLDAINYGTAAPVASSVSRGGGATVVNNVYLTVQGHVTSDRKLLEFVRRGLAGRSVLTPGRNGTVIPRTA